jgi:hypothetical protein
MKKQILSVLLVAAGIVSYAQCDKKIVLTSGSTDYLNSKDELQRTVEEITTVEYDTKEIVITPGEQTLTGAVSSIICNWTTPYKEGKTVIKTALQGQEGPAMNATITIENKEGKIIFLVAFDDMPDIRIRLTLDKFEEKK